MTPEPRDPAITDATAWIQWLVAYRAALQTRLPEPTTPKTPRHATLERGRPERKARR